MKPALKLIRITLTATLRDRSSIFWSFIFPGLLLIGLGLIWGQSGGTELKVGLVGDPNAPLVRRLHRELSATKLFRVVLGAREGELAALRNGERHAVLVCDEPARFRVGTRAARPVALRAYFDPKQEQMSQLTLASLREVVTRVERQMLGQPVVLTLEEQPIRKPQRPEPNPIQRFVAAIIGMAIIQGGLGAAVALVSERQKRSADVFRIVPIPVSCLVAGSLAARVLLTGLQALSVVAAGVLAFGVAVEGSWWVLILMVTLGTLAFTAIGEALAMLARNIETISGLVALVSLPLIFLSGLFFPIDILPEYARSIAVALPSSYLGDGLRWAITGVSTLAPLSVCVATLVAWTIVCFLFSVKFYRWE